MEKAFELSNATVITSKLAEKNITSLLLKWTWNFLTERQIRVRFQGNISEYKFRVNGTSQGSVLSPFLFNILINSLVEINLPRQVQALSYADDIALIATGPQAFTLLQASLNRLSAKLQCLGLKISTDKTKAIAFRTKDPPQQLLIDNTPLEWVKAFQYLGVYIDKHITLSSHIDYITARITKRLNFMRALTSPSIGANAKVLHTFYTTAIRSIIDFGATSLIIAKPPLILKLDKLQNIALRIILGGPKWTNIITMQEETTLLPIPLRLIQICSSFLLAVTRSTAPLILKSLLQDDIDRHHYPAATWAKHANFLLHRFLPAALDYPDNPVQPDPPPWTSPAATFCIDLPKDGKRNTNPHVLSTTAISRIALLNQGKSAVFYTDGSVTHDPSRAGAGITMRISLAQAPPFTRDISI